MKIDVNAAGAGSGNTALHMAAQGFEDHAEVVTLLLQANADPTIKNKVRR